MDSTNKPQDLTNTPRSSTNDSQGRTGSVGTTAPAGVDVPSGAAVRTGPAPAGTAVARQPTDPVATTTPAEAQAVIAEARGRIDDLDARILTLVQERMAVSAEVQTARIAAGGARVALNRELEILARYRSALGPQGTEVAMRLLELCRGRA